MTTSKLDIKQVNLQLAELADRVAAGGEEIVVTRDGTPVAKLVAADPPAAENLLPREPGSAEGMIWMSDDFDDPLDDFAEYM